MIVVYFLQTFYDFDYFLNVSWKIKPHYQGPKWQWQRQRQRGIWSSWWWKWRCWGEHFEFGYGIMVDLLLLYVPSSHGETSKENHFRWTPVLTWRHTLEFVSNTMHACGCMTKKSVRTQVLVMPTPYSDQILENSLQWLDNLKIYRVFWLKIVKSKWL